MLPFRIPLAEWIDEGFDIILPIISPVTDVIRSFVAFLQGNLETLLWSTPGWLLLALLAVVAWRVAGRGLAIFTVFGLLLIDSLGYWTEAMTTFSIVSTGVIIAIGLGVPIGILTARRDSIYAVVRPVLDLMQTMPSFVYLIPAIFLFSIGPVPAVLATVVYSTPPAIRLTNLGIRQVRYDIVEAGRAFGSTPSQLLFKIQLPLALPSIMAGINQTIMLALGMSVIAAMIGAGGLGSVVINALNRVQVGTGVAGGIAIVVMAIILDRITQALGDSETPMPR